MGSGIMSTTCCHMTGLITYNGYIWGWVFKICPFSPFSSLYIAISCGSTKLLFHHLWVFLKKKKKFINEGLGGLHWNFRCLILINYSQARNNFRLIMLRLKNRWEKPVAMVNERLLEQQQQQQKPNGWRFDSKSIEQINNPYIGILDLILKTLVCHRYCVFDKMKGKSPSPPFRPAAC